MLGVAAFGVLFSGIFLHWYVFIKPTDADVFRAFGAPLSAAELPPGLAPPRGGPDGAALRSATLRHLAGRLVWDLEPASGASAAIDATTGEQLGQITPVDASLIAASVVKASPEDAKATLLNEYDGSYYEGDPPLPAYRVSFQRPKRVDVYVDAATGEVMAVVGTRERITLIFGAELHYLKFGPLRLTKYTTLRFIIMGALATAVLVSGVSGLFYGVPLLLRRRWRWMQGRLVQRSTLLRAAHHCLGVVAGVFVVGWGLSSYMMLWRPSMDPSPAETARVEGGFVDRDAYHIRVPEALATATAAGRGPVFMLRAQRLAGRPVYEAYQAPGVSTLVDGMSGRVLSPISDSLVRAIVAHYLGRDPRIKQITYLDHHDAYYRGSPYGRGYSFDGHRLPLPVYRVDLTSTALPSPLYIDAIRGRLTARVDGNYRVFRWLGSAIHNFDYPSLLERPRLWDLVVVIPALLGVLLSGSGLWLGFRHLIRKSQLGRDDTGGTPTTGPGAQLT